jgi:hypothetical protein
MQEAAVPETDRITDAVFGFLANRRIFVPLLCARSLMDRASDYGSEGSGFDSLRARKEKVRLGEPFLFERG